MSIHSFISQAMTLPIPQQEAIALCMLQNVLNCKSVIEHESKRDLPMLPPVLPPETRLLQEAITGKKTFRQGRTANGKTSIQGAIVDLVRKNPGLPRREVAEKVQSNLGCTYKQAYQAIGMSQHLGKTATKNGGIYPTKKVA